MYNQKHVVPLLSFSPENHAYESLGIDQDMGSVDSLTAKMVEVETHLPTWYRFTLPERDRPAVSDGSSTRGTEGTQSYADASVPPLDETIISRIFLYFSGLPALYVSTFVRGQWQNDNDEQRKTSENEVICMLGHLRK